VLKVYRGDVVSFEGVSGFMGQELTFRGVSGETLCFDFWAHVTDTTKAVDFQRISSKRMAQ
jgi:hypothetical protein